MTSEANTFSLTDQGKWHTSSMVMLSALFLMICCVCVGMSYIAISHGAEDKKVKDNRERRMLYFMQYGCFPEDALRINLEADHKVKVRAQKKHNRRVRKARSKGPRTF